MNFLDGASLAIEGMAQEMHQDIEKNKQRNQVIDVERNTYEQSDDIENVRWLRSTVDGLYTQDGRMWECIRGVGGEEYLRRIYYHYPYTILDKIQEFLHTLRHLWDLVNPSKHTLSDDDEVRNIVSRIAVYQRERREFKFWLLEQLNNPLVWMVSCLMWNHKIEQDKAKRILKLLDTWYNIHKKDPMHLKE